jgi:hypothetical protein
VSGRGARGISSSRVGLEVIDRMSTLERTAQAALCAGRNFA